MAAIADEHRLPVENLLAPDTVRRLAWGPPGGPTPDAATVAEFLRGHGARRWQVSLTAAALAGALDRALRHQEVGDPIG
jgi:ribonuclease D